MTLHLSHRRPRRSFGAAATITSLLAALAFASPLANADEFTVGHSGADVAFSQNRLDGTGITVAVVDSGVHFSNDLAATVKGGPSRIVGAATFGVTNTDDFCGHGTHVGAIIAGNGAASTGNQYYRTFYGVARNANLVNVHVLDKTGQGTVSQVIAGIQWCVANKATYNIRVINLSVGHPVGESYTTDPLCQAVEAAWKAGIVVVCAAGNAGRSSAVAAPGATANEGYGTAYGSIQSPGNDPYVITVGAMKTTDGTKANDKIATYSSRGPSRLDFILKPDIVAPGNRVISLNTNNSYLALTYGSTNLIPNASYILNNPTGTSKSYFQLSGTSMATPVVSGAVALMLQKDPTLTPDTIKARLMMSADKWTQPDGTADPCTFGAGYIDIPAALNCSAIATQSALSPALIQDGSGNVMVDTSQILWGTATGSQVIWGVSGVNDLRTIWGSQVIWGTSNNTLSASQILWGTSVWSDQIIWGTVFSAADLSLTAITGE